jgi:hypothetical protein
MNDLLFEISQQSRDAVAVLRAAGEQSTRFGQISLYISF